LHTSCHTTPVWHQHGVLVCRVVTSQHVAGGTHIYNTQPFRYIPSTSDTVIGCNTSGLR